jgi:hypothetical protein
VRALAEKLRTRQSGQASELLTVKEVQALKKAEQDIAHRMWRAEDAGQTIPASERIRAQFAEKVQAGARQAVEDRIPEASQINKRLYDLMQIERAGNYLADRNPIGIGGAFSTLARLIGGPSPATLTGRLLHNPVAGTITRPGVAGGAVGALSELQQELMRRELAKAEGVER